MDIVKRMMASNLMASKKSQKKGIRPGDEKRLICAQVTASNPKPGSPGCMYHSPTKRPNVWTSSCRGVTLPKQRNNASQTAMERPDHMGTFFEGIILETYCDHPWSYSVKKYVRHELADHNALWTVGSKYWLQRGERVSRKLSRWVLNYRATINARMQSDGRWPNMYSEASKLS